ncbi:MAG: hypothetical protein FWE32_03875 [Oscillospiraceae bacterium]|nr:hypothetical protein [Oscillospiraceae bacterium]
MNAPFTTAVVPVNGCTVQSVRPVLNVTVHGPGTGGGSGSSAGTGVTSFAGAGVAVRGAGRGAGGVGAGASSLVWGGGVGRGRPGNRASASIGKIVATMIAAISKLSIRFISQALQKLWE